MGGHFMCPWRSGRIVNQLASHVSINVERMNAFSDKLLQSICSGQFGLGIWSQHELHPKEANDVAIEWIFLVDSLNFSFWMEGGNETQYAVHYRGNNYTGYWALCAGINRAIEEKTLLPSASFYSRIEPDTLKKVFRGRGDVEIPLMKERLEVLHENGRILAEQFDGKFKNCLLKCDHSALTLLQLIIEHFPSFRDQCTYKGHQVSFYKRAQILIADIWACFNGQGIGYFKDIDSLTMFADYRVPQVLQYFGVLEYSDELKEVLNRKVLLKSGDPLEVEVRGQSIYAVHLMAERMRQKLKDQNDSSSVNSVLIDFYLWDYRRQNVEKVDSGSSPYHKVRSIYY